MFDGSTLSVTTNALARPEIVERTFASFSENLVGVSFKDIDLFLNVDPIPKDKAKIEEVVEVGNRFFRTVYVRTPPTPNMPLALNWTWEQTQTDVILNLEDDWILESPVDTLQIHEAFKLDPKLVQVVLRAYMYEYVLIPGSPSFFSKVFYKSYAGRFNSTACPEKQFRFKEMWPFPDVHQAVYGNHVILKDIGKPWIEKHGLKKPELKINFNTYINLDEFK
jgi:hypothetical protein